MEDAISLAASAVISDLMCLSDRVWYVYTRADNIGNVLIKRQRLVKCRAKQLHGRNVLKNQQR